MGPIMDEDGGGFKLEGVVVISLGAVDVRVELGGGRNQGFVVGSILVVS